MSEMSAGVAAGYLAAMIDGEGTVSATQRRIRIVNTDYDIILGTLESCRVLGIDRVLCYKAGKTVTGKTVWEVVINGYSRIQVVLDCVPVQSERKRALIEKALVRKYRKLTPVDVADIKLRAHEHGSGRRLAREYGVSGGLISAIKHGRVWRTA